MAPRVEALAQPALLRWARENSNLTIEEAAKNLPTAPERLGAWEAGQAHPTIKQLRILGRIYKRPIAVFYLPEPPGPGPQLLHDFRHHWGTGSGTISRALRGEIELA